MSRSAMLIWVAMIGVAVAGNVEFTQPVFLLLFPCLL